MKHSTARRCRLLLPFICVVSSLTWITVTGSALPTEEKLAKLPPDGSEVAQIDLSEVVIEVDEDPSEVEELNNKVNHFRPVSLPNKFDDYDINEKDGAITVQELSKVSGTKDGIELVFKAADTNG